MSRMNRVLLTAGALLMLVSSAAMAFAPYPNPVRVYTLSGGDSFNSNFILDSNDAYSWFGRIYRNADHLRVTWEPRGEAQGLGFIKSEQTYGAYMLHLQSGNTTFDRQLEGEFNHFTLGYGYAFESFDIGLVYNRQGASADIDEGGARAEVSETYNAFGAGITYDMSDQTAFDFSFMFVTGSEDDGVAEDPEDDFETTGFGVGARAFYAWREDVTLIPVFTFNSYTDSYSDIDDENKGTAFAAGLGFDYTINEDNDLYLFLSFQSMKDEETYEIGGETYTDEFTTTAMPGIGAAVEHELTDMFTIRMGATKNWVKEEETFDAADTTDEYKSYPWMFTFGMGIALGDWVIDLELNQDWMYQAGYWFHGADPVSEPPVAQIEAKLWF